MATTLRRMMKKTASSVISVANRKTGNYTISTTNLFRSTSIPTHHRFSSLAEKSSDINDTLLSLIECGLDRAQEKFRKFAETPREFPFKIVRETGIEVIELTREYQGEEIKVTGFPRDDQQSVSLHGSVWNKSELVLDFHVEINAADGIKIDSFDVKNQDDFYRYSSTTDRPRFSELDEKVQKAFHKYLEVRGFEPSFTENFYQGMAENKHEKYTALLMNLKNFIAISNTNSTKNQFETTSIPTLAEKRSNADDTLLSVIETEIACAEEKFHKFMKAAPREFPFKILDDAPLKGYIRLTREYHGEEIKVTVHEPSSNYSDDKEVEDKDEKRHSQRAYFGITVSKKSERALNFDVLADVADGKITISSFKVSKPKASHYDYNYYKQHDFSDLDETLKKTFHKYLEIRGFEPRNAKFICDYMVQRKHMKFTPLLKKLKTFIAN